MFDEANAVALRIVRDVVRQSKPDTFEELVEKCDGLFPTEIARAVQELDLRSFPQAVPIDSGSAKRAKISDRPKRELAVPHPLDFDWRFDERDLFSPGNARPRCNTARGRCGCLRNADRLRGILKTAARSGHLPP